ncbi:MAG: S-layer homology domain-containing protein, partial [Clostridia bacterium]|nr:S-layer homology domain-containing protein [Clostridia bacterium]
LALKVARIKTKTFEPCFTDVAEGQWFANTLYEANKRGIIPAEMVVDGAISPDLAITREEMTAILVNLWEGIRGNIKTNDKTFTDADSISPWAKESVLKAVSMGVVTGNPDGSFAPKNNATRAEMAVMFFRLNNKFKAPVVPTANGEYSPVYKGIMHDDVDIQKLITDAYNSGAKSVTLPEGVFRVYSNAAQHILLEDMKDFTIDGNGATLLFQGKGRNAIDARRCENLTIKNLIMDFEFCGNSQAEIVAIDPKGFYYDVYIEPGYAQDFKDKDLFNYMSGDFYDPDGRIVTTAASWEVKPEYFQPLGDNVYRLNAPRLVQADPNIKEGYYLTWRNNVGHGMYFNGCDGIYLQDITMYGTANGVNEMYGNATRTSKYERVHLIPGPAPLGSVTPRLRGVAGTGFHYVALRNPVHMYDCSVIGSGDDGVNVHGLYHRISEKKGDKKLILAAMNGNFLKGDTLAFYNDNYEMIGKAKVVSSKKLEPGYLSPIDKELRTDVGVWVFGPGAFHEVTVDTALPFELPGWVVNRNETCAGLIIKDSFIGQGRARGLLIKTDSVIENCVVERRPIAVKLGPELTWLESDFTSDILVKNTIIRDSGFQNTGWDNPIGTLVGGEVANGEGGGIDNENIVFDGCTFEGNNGVQMELKKTRNLTLQNCIFKAVGNTTGHIYAENIHTLNLINNTFEGDFEAVKIGANVGTVNKQ